MRAALLVWSVGVVLLGAGCGANTGNTSTGCQSCGGTTCVDLKTDAANCGVCGNVCAIGQTCQTGTCAVPGGGGGGGGPACTQGATESCYSGASATKGVGACKAGTRTCLSSGQWGACTGEVLPVAEVCANGADDDCNGTVDDDPDLDGDGYTHCGGDCCDSASDGCTNPAAVNPGAFDSAGNQLDDDCDGTVDNAAAGCDGALASNTADPMDAAKALDLCQAATATDTKWGVVSAKWLMPSGTGTPNADQHAPRPAFGSTPVQKGTSLLVLSTANAAAPGQVNPSFSSYVSTGHGTSSGYPADWYAANGNALPNAPGCPGPTGSSARDPVMLELKIRAPSNAKSFSLKTNFMSAEYPEWTCSPYNDFFVVLLDSAYAGQPANPADKNLAFYETTTGNRYPVGVNLATGNTGLFTQCKNGATGCMSSAVAGTISTCTGTDQLTGTGMEVQSSGCGSNDLVGGGTGWLTTRGNVVPGEVFTLRIALWDTSDANFDSVALIDGFEWSLEVAQPGTGIN